MAKVHDRQAMHRKADKVDRQAEVHKVVERDKQAKRMAEVRDRQAGRMVMVRDIWAKQRKAVAQRNHMVDEHKCLADDVHFVT